MEVLDSIKIMVVYSSRAYDTDLSRGEDACYTYLYSLARWQLEQLFR